MMDCPSKDCKYYKKREKANYIMEFNFAEGGFCTKGYCKKQFQKKRK